MVVFFLKRYIVEEMNEYKILTACKIYLVMVGMAYKKSLKREGSGKVSASHFRLFDWIHSPLLFCFILPLAVLSFHYANSLFDLKQWKVALS